MTVIDSHAYVGESLFHRDQSIEDLLRSMDRLKIDRATLCPNKPRGYALESANKWVASEIKTHPDRFFGWVRVDPWQGEEALIELKRGIEDLGLNGLLLHPQEEQFQISNRFVDPLFAYAKIRSIPVMIEAGYHLLSHPFDIAEIAHRFLEVNIIATHGLQLDDAGFALTDAEFVMKECPNIIMETSGMYAPDTMLGVVNNLGTERLIFGSHSPWLNQEFELDRVLRMKLDQRQRSAVLGGNLLKLFKKN
jgi:uncharacterized protein